MGGFLASVLEDTVSVRDQTVGGHRAKRRRTEKDGKHKMSTNRGVSPSLSITPQSYVAGVGVGVGRAASEERIFQGLHS